jgi:hypothetical protein
VFAASGAFAEPQLAPNAPQDKPGGLTAEQTNAFERAIAPYVAKARASYPEAKNRFLAGLPRGQAFFLTTRLHDKDGKWEQVFIAVERIKDSKVTGSISSDLNTVKGFKRGQKYTFPESELLDWLITKPDGKEEGNFVGNFLDTHKQ